MTSLHPRSTDSAQPGPPADGVGSAPPGGAPAVTGAPPVTAVLTAVPGPPVAGAPVAGAPDAGPPVPGVASPGAASLGAALCAVATAADHAGVTVGAPVAPARHDSVPQPRTPEDVEAQLRQAATDGTATDGATDSTADSTADGAATDSAADDTATDGTATGSAATAERLRAAFTERLRSAAAPPEGNRPAPAARSAREELRGLGSRRPSPSRRLRRMHPQTDRTGQEATARETAATDPTGAPGAPTRGAGPAGAPTGATGASTDRAPLAGGRTATEAGPAGAPGRGSAAGSGPWAEEFGVEPPLGILIGGSPVQSEAVGRPEERAPVRVAAEPIRVGRGTSLVVLPSWRPAIAVSVSTEQLLAETGLSIDQLAVTRLTVWMNPWALHDRELDLHGWEPGPSGQAGPAGRARRGGPGGPGGRGQGPSGRDPISPEASRNR